MLGAHDRYTRLLEYGDATEFHTRLNEYCGALKTQPAIPDSVT
jgi:hypothetical protein